MRQQFEAMSRSARTNVISSEGTRSFGAFFFGGYFGA
jgi:hypothetical protein